MDEQIFGRAKADLEIVVTAELAAKEWVIEEVWYRLLFEGCFIVSYDFIEFELGFCARNFTHFDVIFAVAVAEVLSIGFRSCVALTVSCFVFAIVRIC